MITRMRKAGVALLRLVSPKGTSALSITSTADPAGDLPLGDTVAPVVAEENTLDPEIVTRKGDALTGLKVAVLSLGDTYAPGMIRDLFTEAATMFAELFIEYRRVAADKLEATWTAFKESKVEVIDVKVATEALKSELKAHATKRLDLIDALKAKIVSAKAEYRRLTIGITGNPALVVKATAVGLALMLPVAAAFAVSLYFEIVFNVPILQDQGNRDMAVAFSILVSLAGSITTFMAGMARRAELDHRNAVTEKLSCFGPDGIDPETKKPAEVFPLSGDAQFKLRLWHSLMAIVIAGTLVIRYIMMTQLGDIAGSFGVVLVFLVLYGWEAIFAEVTHPLASECLKQKKEAEETENELKALEGNIASPETQIAFNDYGLTLTTNEAVARTKTETRKKAADTFRRLASEFLASPTWFTEQFREFIEGLVGKIGAVRTETDDELADMTREVKPAFSTTDLPFDIASEMQAASDITVNVEVKGSRMTAAELDKTLETLTDELTKERARNKAAEATAVKIMPKVITRPAWRAPRLS